MSSRVVGPANVKATRPTYEGRTQKLSSKSAKTRTLNTAPQRKPAPLIMVAKTTDTLSIRVRKPNSSETTRRMHTTPMVNLLDFASQLYPWIFMCHSITEASKACEAEFETQLTTHTKELEAGEEVSREDFIRYQTERQIALLDEISSEHLCRSLPDLVRQIIRSDSFCQDIFANALDLSMGDKSDMYTIRNQLQLIESTLLELSTVQITLGATMRTENMGPNLFSALEGFCMLLDTRAENLILCKKILTSVRENARAIQHLKSLDS